MLASYRLTSEKRVALFRSAFAFNSAFSSTADPDLLWRARRPYPGPNGMLSNLATSAASSVEVAAAGYDEQREGKAGRGRSGCLLILWPDL